MAFKKIQPNSAVPDSPEKLFLDLPRRKIPNVMPHQQDVMRNYASTAIDAADVALQLPTGSGKTLVGLLIGEWRRRKFNERIVYLAPTKQLVNQIVEQAEEKYGLTVNGFVGPKSAYDPTARTNYRLASNIAVTTYSSLFNNNPFFNDAQVIILDDVHACENYISGLWSIKIERTKPEHAALHAALSMILKPLLEPFNFARLIGQVDNISDRTWVDKLPTPDFINLIPQITEVLDVNNKGDFSYSWNLVKDHLQSCHLYISSQDILIRPLIPPTWTHEAFSKAKQRIYMSATLGEGGDLERLVGRAPITRLPVSEGWDRQGVGRRFFIFPEFSLTNEDSKALRLSLMQQTERSLVLVPNARLRDEITDEVRTIGYQIFGAEDIEETKSVFASSIDSVAIVANRYDGIDFPGDECRLLFIEGLPRATNIQERFLMAKMGANALFNERIQTRVLQAIGRCTRSLEDYSAVIITGVDLPDYLADRFRLEYFHPELQAELVFGIEQSKNIKADGIIENLNIFLENGAAWEDINQQIVNLRKTLKQKPFPAMKELQEAVASEIGYQRKLWQKDYESALGFADSVLSIIKSPDLKGYRALWHYLAGSAAWLAVNSGSNVTFAGRAKDEFDKAKKAATGINWLVPLSRYSGIKAEQKEVDDSVILEQVERLESVLSSLGNTYERKYSAREKEILEGLHSANTSIFENAHMLLGNMLGFESDKKESEGSPDPWWISANICLVFEDHSGASSSSFVDVTKARQAASHPKWMRTNVAAASKAFILPVLITPVQCVKSAAVTHLEDVSLWKLGDFQKWSKDALATIRELRTSFTEPGNLDWRSNAVELLKKRGFDAVSLINYLKANMAKDILKPIP